MNNWMQVRVSCPLCRAGEARSKQEEEDEMLARQLAESIDGRLACNAQYERDFPPVNSPTERRVLRLPRAPSRQNQNQRLRQIEMFINDEGDQADADERQIDFDMFDDYDD